MDDLWRGDVTVVRSTEKALLINYEGEEEWIPKSQIHDDSEVYSEETKEGELVIPMWLAERTGWA